MYIICDCSHGDHISVQEVFAEGAYDLFLKIAVPRERPIRYINVGANVGAFDLRLLDLGITVEAGLTVELNPNTFQRCLLNITTNDARNVNVVNCGIAAHETVIEFEPSESSLGDNIFAQKSVSGESSGRSHKVKLMPLSTLLQQNAPDIEEFDLLKLDCEGAEYLILESTPSAVLRRFRAVIVEFHPAPVGYSLVRAYECLSAAGFSSHLGGPQKGQYVDLFRRVQ